MEVTASTGREDKIYQQPIFPPGSACVPWGVKKRTETISRATLCISCSALSEKAAQLKCYARKSGTGWLRVPAVVTTQGP